MRQGNSLPSRCCAVGYGYEMPFFFSLLALSSSATEVTILELSTWAMPGTLSKPLMLWVILTRILWAQLLCFQFSVDRRRLELSFREVVINVMCLDHPLVLGLWNSNNIWPLCRVKANQRKPKVDSPLRTTMPKGSERWHHQVNSLWVMEQGRRKARMLRQAFSIRMLKSFPGN